MAALALLLFSLVCRVQTGVRLVLPLMGLSVIGLAAAPGCRSNESLLGIGCDLC